MPIMRTPIAEVEAAITRPVAIETANRIMEITGIPKDTRIFLRDISEVTYQNGSLLNDTGHEEVKLASSSQVTIEVAERVDMELIGRRSSANIDHREIWWDPNLGISVRPIYSPQFLQFTFTYKSSSRTHAKAWRENIWDRMQNDVLIHEHTLKYHYMLSPVFLDYLIYLHSLRENQAGYGQDFESYFHQYASPALTRVSSSDGKKSHVVFAETQEEVHGWFDFAEELQEPQRDNTTNTYSTSFTYNLHYWKPTSQVLMFPVMVHNQPVDRRLIFAQDPVKNKPRPARRSLSGGSYRLFEQGIQPELMANQIKGFVSPEWDDITYLHNNDPATTFLFSGLCQFEDPNSTFLLNLTDLGDFALDNMFLDYLKDGNHVNCTKYHMTPIRVELYRNGKLAHPSEITVDSDLNVNLVAPPDMRVAYRVKLAVYSAIEKINPAVLNQLVNEYPEFLQFLCSAIPAHRGEVERLRPSVDLRAYYKYMSFSGRPDRITDMITNFRANVEIHNVAVRNITRG